MNILFTILFYALQILMLIGCCFTLFGLITMIADGMGIIPLIIGTILFTVATWGAAQIYIAYPETPMSKLTEEFFTVVLHNIDYLKIQ